MNKLGFLSYFWRAEEKPQQTNFGEELRKMMQSKEFEEKLDAASPFLYTSLVAWPGYWLYKGLEWNNMRGQIPLQLYIRKTFFQAKMMQFFIITTGIFVAINHDPRHKILQIHDA